MLCKTPRHSIKKLYKSKPAGAPPPVLYRVASLQATPSSPRLASPTCIYVQNVTKKQHYVQSMKETRKANKETQKIKSHGFMHI